MLNNKLTIAIVGNSPNILNYEYGEEIDSHDFVLRFNNFVLDGYEKQLGSKITHIMNVVIGTPDTGRKTYVNLDKLLTLPKEHRLIRDNVNYNFDEIMDYKLTKNDVIIVNDDINKKMKEKISTRDYSSANM